MNNKASRASLYGSVGRCRVAAFARASTAFATPKSASHDDADFGDADGGARGVDVRADADADEDVSHARSVVVDAPRAARASATPRRTARAARRRHARAAVSIAEIRVVVRRGFRRRERRGRANDATRHRPTDPYKDARDALLFIIIHFRV